MRLDSKEINAIVDAIREVSKGPIYLFGSRVDDDKRGGDIDLFIDDDKLQISDVINILVRIKEKIGEQKIDLLIPKKLHPAFVEHIKETGLRLA